MEQQLEQQHNQSSEAWRAALSPFSLSDERFNPQRSLQSVRQACDNLSRLVRSNPWLEPMQPGKPESMHPHQLGADVLLQHIGNSARTFIELGRFVRDFNLLGMPSSDRDIGAAAALMPVALLDVHARREREKAGERVALSAEELLMYKAFAASHDGSINPPDWFWTAYPLVNCGGRMQEMPSIEVYLRHSPSLKAEFLPLEEKRSDLQQKEGEAAARADRFDKEKNTDGAKNQRERAAQLHQEIEKVDKEMWGMRDRISDVRPELLEECCNCVRVSAMLKPDAARGLIMAAKNAARLVALAIDPELLPLPERKAMDLPQLVCRDYAASLARLRVGMEPLADQQALKNVLPELVRMFHGLREALVAVYGAMDTARDNKQETRQLKSELEQQIDRLFPFDAEKNKKLTAAILADRRPEMQDAAADLLTSRIRIAQAGGGATTASIFESPENIELLSWAVDALLGGREGQVKKIKGTLQQSALQPVVSFTTAVRGALEKGNVVELGRILDDEIRLCRESPTQVSYGRLAALILSLQAVARNEKMRRNLKSRLQRLDEVSEIARSLTGKVADSSKAAAAFIEKSRSDIVRLYSVDLNDYCGHVQEVTRYKRLLDNYILLMETPDAWKGMNPTEVFLNGHLIWGPPGTGKTFLITCMCNSLGIPKITISREEMAGAYRQAKASGSEYGSSASLAGKAEERMEAKLTAFIKGKVQEAKDSMEKNGKKVCLMFFDEIEGEMMEREMVKNSPDQIALTNAMLRVMEAQIQKHAEILFVAATNHIDLIDAAAHRLGRFGIIIEIGGTSIEDVKILARRTLEMQELKLDTSDGNPEFEALAKAAMGMNPLPIKTALTNLCCVKRAQAMRAGTNQVEVTYAELMGAIMDMRRYTEVRKGVKKPNLEKDVHEIGINLETLTAALAKLTGVGDRKQTAEAAPQ